MKTILIDDERKAIAILQKKIAENCPELDIVAYTQNPSEGIDLIKELSPDIVFLDISMPVLSGFDVLAKLENIDFETIFVTAYDDYAIEAIENRAIGYIVKPISDQKLVNAVNNAILNRRNKKGCKTQNKNTLSQKTDKTNKKIVVSVHNGIEFISIENILSLEGANGYTKIHLDNGNSILTSQRLGHYAELLEEFYFFKVHKSHIVNCNKIKKLTSEGNLVLGENFSVPVSRTRKSAFMDFIS